MANVIRDQVFIKVTVVLTSLQSTGFQNCNCILAYSSAKAS
jgi:hypothetical protein